MCGRRGAVSRHEITAGLNGRGHLVRLPGLVSHRKLASRQVDGALIGALAHSHAGQAGTLLARIKEAKMLKPPRDHLKWICLALVAGVFIALPLFPEANSFIAHYLHWLYLASGFGIAGAAFFAPKDDPAQK